MPSSCLFYPARIPQSGNVGQGHDADGGILVLQALVTVVVVHVHLHLAQLLVLKLEIVGPAQGKGTAFSGLGKVGAFSRCRLLNLIKKLELVRQHLPNSDCAYTVSTIHPRQLNAEATLALTYERKRRIHAAWDGRRCDTVGAGTDQSRPRLL